MQTTKHIKERLDGPSDWQSDMQLRTAHFRLRTVHRGHVHLLNGVIGGSRHHNSPWEQRQSPGDICAISSTHLLSVFLELHSLARKELLHTLPIPRDLRSSFTRTFSS